jgi:hypothetical protein
MSRLVHREVIDEGTSVLNVFSGIRSAHLDEHIKTNQHLNDTFGWWYAKCIHLERDSTEEKEMSGSKDIYEYHIWISDRVPLDKQLETYDPFRFLKLWFDQWRNRSYTVHIKTEHSFRPTLKSFRERLLPFALFILNEFPQVRMMFEIGEPKQRPLQYLYRRIEELSLQRPTRLPFQFLCWRTGTRGDEPQEMKELTAIMTNGAIKKRRLQILTALFGHNDKQCTIYQMLYSSAYFDMHVFGIIVLGYLDHPLIVVDSVNPVQ